MMKGLVIALVAGALASSSTYLLMRPNQADQVVLSLAADFVRQDIDMKKMEARMDVLPECWQFAEPPRPGGG